MTLPGGERARWSKRRLPWSLWAALSLPGTTAAPVAHGGDLGLDEVLVYGLAIVILALIVALGRPWRD